MEKKCENVPTHEVNRLVYVKELIQGQHCFEVDRKSEMFYFNKDLFRKEFDEKDFDNLCNELKQQIFDKKFEPKPQTNRQWMKSLSDEEYAINIYQICIKLLQICLEKNADNEDCTIEQLIVDWLQAEHKE